MNSRSLTPLGKFVSLRAMLDKEFGKGYYTDDNEVIEPEGNTAVAFLFPSSEGRLVIKYFNIPGQEPKPDKLVFVEGASA